jgi:hypothetical protein
MSKKLKYGLKKKHQKETNKLVVLTLSYDHEDDEMSVGIAIRNDATNAELLLRMEQHISTSLRFIANGGEAWSKEEDVSGFIAHEKCSGDKKKDS